MKKYVLFEIDTWNNTRCAVELIKFVNKKDFGISNLLTFDSPGGVIQSLVKAEESQPLRTTHAAENGEVPLPAGA